MHLQGDGRPRVSCWFPTRRAVMARDACARNLDETLDGIAREAYEAGQEVSSRGSVSVRAVWHAPRECSIWTVGATRSVLGKLEARGAARTYTDLGRLQDHLRRASETCREASRSLSRRKADKVSARPTLGWTRGGTYHRRRDADLGHAAALRGGDGRSALVQHADGRRRQQERLDVALGVVRDELLQVAEGSVDGR
jgi:hypothetical protein